MSTTTARAAAVRLAREIRQRDLAGLMPEEIKNNTRMQQLIEQASGTILDDRAPDGLVRGCADDLVKLLLRFSREGIFFERPAGKQSIGVMLRKVKIRSSLEAAAIELADVPEVLV